MTEPILHQYPTSPFAEKIRRVLAFKGLAWRAVEIPMVMPKPDVEALTGGYRKTPILQIGADIYCDTALICDVLEHLQPEPTLYPLHAKGLSRIVAHWADNQMFWAAMGHSFHPRGAAQVMAGQTPEQAKAFGEDRMKMRVAVPRMPPADATGAYRSHLRRIANMLEEGEFLLGLQPSIADFAVYHPLWFTRHRATPMATIFETTPSVLEWMDRIAALGEERRSPMTPAEAIDVARAATPAPLDAAEPFQDDHGIALGARVTVASDAFGPEPTEGELVAATRMHYTLRREDPRAGTVHVHFPRMGYVMRAVKPA